MKSAAIAVLLAASLSTGLSAAPVKPDFCSSFKRVVAAASEKPPFQSISGPVIDDSDRQAKLLLPGFAKCRIGSYKYDNPGYYCTISGLPEQQAQTRMAEYRSKIETCLGGKMVEDWERSTNPWVLKAGGATYPMAWTNVLRNGDVAVGYVSAYRQP